MTRLVIEPTEPAVVEKIRLRARVQDNSNFIFIPEYWEEALKPFKKAHWKSDWGYSQGNKVPARQDYRIISGNFLVFPEFDVDGGFYAAHLYMVVCELPNQQIQGTFMKDTLTLKVLEQGKVYQTVNLKSRAAWPRDTFYHAVMWNMW